MDTHIIFPKEQSRHERFVLLSIIVHTWLLTKFMKTRLGECQVWYLHHKSPYSNCSQAFLVCFVLLELNPLIHASNLEQMVIYCYKYSECAHVCGYNFSKNFEAFAEVPQSKHKFICHKYIVFPMHDKLGYAWNQIISTMSIKPCFMNRWYMYIFCQVTPIHGILAL